MVNMGMGMGLTPDCTTPDTPHTPTYPYKWANILNAPLNEGSVSTYLEALYGCITDKFVPNPSIIQSLLYFTHYPPTIPAHTPTPMMILSKISQSHPLSSLMKHNTLPTYQRQKVDTPQWLNWEAGGELEKGIKRRMRRCEKEGIWDLIWEDPVSPKVEVKVEGEGKGRRGRERRRGGSEEDEEEEREGEGTKRVSENGWIVLEWLVRLWDQDQKVRGDYSLAFLAQLPKQGDMQIDNPSLPLQVIYSALEHPSTGEEQRRRENTAGRLLSLLINTANPPAPAKPPFHPQTLPLSLLPLFRLPPDPLTKFTQIISFAPIPKSTIAHLLVHAIEDLAGIRSKKADERRRGNKEFLDGEGRFPRPVIGYGLDLLLLPPKSTTGEGGGDEDGEERMAILKLVLISTLIQCTTPISTSGLIESSQTIEGGWVQGRDPEWRGLLISRMSGHGAAVDGMREVLVMMLDRLGHPSDQSQSRDGNRSHKGNGAGTG